jgi:hypothetical protein
VWGELVYENGEEKPFHYVMKDWFLQVGEGEDADELFLDEKGIVV